MFVLKKVEHFTPDIASILAQCVFNPDVDKMNQIVKRYEEDPLRIMYAYYRDGKDAEAAAIIGVELHPNVKSAVILHIAVDHRLRGKGIGRRLVGETMLLHGVNRLEAETDSDAVDFYRSCGFTVTSLGELYPGIERFRCVRNFRLLDSADAETYRELRLHSLLETPEAFLTTYEIEKEKPIEQVRRNLERSENRFTLGAFNDNELSGTVTFVREGHPKTRHKGNVYAMYVSPEFRGKGIGKALMLELVSLAKNCDGLEQINLNVIASNTRAKRLYESIGFTVYGTERNALKSGNQHWDEDLMVCWLV